MSTEKNAELRTETASLMSYGKAIEVIGWLAVLGAVALTVFLMTQDRSSIDSFGDFSTEPDALAGLAEGLPLVVAALVLAAVGRAMRAFSVYAARDIPAAAPARPPDPGVELL